MVDRAAYRAKLLALSSTQRRAYLATLTREQQLDLIFEWSFWRRGNQTAPPGAWRWWLIDAGRGFGKTRTAAEWIRERVRDGDGKHVAFVGRTVADVRDVMIEGPSGILAVSPPSERPLWTPSLRSLVWPVFVAGRATYPAHAPSASTFSSENVEQARGPEHDTVWGDEIAAWQDASKLYQNIDLGLRRTGPKGGMPRGVFSTTPKPTPLIRALLKDTDVAITRGSTYDNAANLDASFMRIIEKAYKGTRLGRQEVFAELLDDVEGALWTSTIIEANRTIDHPPLVRLGICIDPATTSKKNSDETGIIVIGAGDDGDGYVVEDLSCKLSVTAWARRAVDAYHEWKADEIIAEVNQGGDMVAAAIHSIDPRVRVREIHARRGKFTRAEPVAALYEQGRVHHVGMFAALEDQMTSWTGLVGERSTDRMDALVHGATAVLLDDIESLDVGYA